MNKANYKNNFFSIIQNESGAVLIIVLLIMALILVMGSSSVSNTAIEVMISSNFKDSVEAFYAADAGIEHAKAAISATSISSALAGADNDKTSTTDNGILFGGSTILPTNGSYSVVVNDDDEDDDGISCPGDADDDCWTDSNGRAIVTSTGISASGRTNKIEILIGDSFFDDLPGAISFIGNSGSEDRVEIDLSGDIKGAIITGLDTNDGSTSVGDGSCNDKAGLATQEGGSGFIWDGEDGDNLDDWGINEVTDSTCVPTETNCLYTILSGAVGKTYEINAGGPTEAETSAQIANFENRKDINITASRLTNTSYTNFGTSGDPKITVIQGAFDIDRNITGYGVLIVKGKLRLDGNDLEYHGLIYIINDGELEVNDSDANDSLDVWGGIVMMDSSLGGEERLRLNNGAMRIYYSCQAINSYVAPLTNPVTLAWRELG